MVSQKAKNTRRRIIAAATTSFSERGFSGTTMRDIAQRANVTQAAVHHYFGAKEQVYEEVFKAAAEGFVGIVGTDIPEGVEFLTEGLPTLFAWLGANREHRRLQMWARLEGRMPDLAEADAMLDALRSWTLQAQERGLVRQDVDPDAVLVVLDSLFKGYWDRSDDGWVKRIDSISERALRQMMDLVLRGLLTPECLDSLDDTKE